LYIEKTGKLVTCPFFLPFSRNSQKFYFLFLYIWLIFLPVPGILKLSVDLMIFFIFPLSIPEGRTGLRLSVFSISSIIFLEYFKEF